MKKLGLIFRETSEDLIKKNLKLSESLIIINYAKISGLDVGLLRLSLREAGARLLMVKNSIARRALKGTAVDALPGIIDGPCGLIFVKEEPVAASRVLCEFLKTHELLKLQGGLMGEKTLEGKDIEALAKLPSKEVLRAQAVMTLKSPISGLVIALNSVLKKFVICLDQIRQKKENTK